MKKYETIVSFYNMTLSKKQLAQLRLLQICPNRERSKLIRKLPNSCIKSVCECVLNVLQGRIRLSKQQKAKLSRHKHTLRKVIYKKTSLASKRRLIIQKGGFLQYLIPAALSTLSTLFHGSR